jgi:MFS family permease
MLAIARYTLKGPFHAATMVGVLALLSLVIPLVSILSGALVALIILSQGLGPGLRIIAVAVAGVTVLTYALIGSALFGITFGVVQWLPLVIMAEILRRSQSLSLALVAGMALAMLVVVLQYLLWPDAEMMWVQMFGGMFGDVEQTQGVDTEQVRSIVANMAHWMELLMVAVMFSVFVSTLLAGRWFEHRLFERGSLRDEFYAVRLGKTAAMVAVGASLASMVLALDMLSALALVALAAFMYQGLAIVHKWARHYGKSGWLALLYIMMAIFPHVLVMVAALGVIDNWTDIRAKLKSVPAKTDE